MDKPLSRAALILKNAADINQARRQKINVQIEEPEQEYSSVRLSRSGRKLTASRRLFSCLEANVRPTKSTSTPKVNRKVRYYY
jgi:hypothetical protein